MNKAAASALGLDFGTTNSVVALADGRGGTRLVEFGDAGDAVFRSALCFWEEERGWNGIAHEAGPWAIDEYLQSPLDSRFIQSFKSVAASPLFERTMIWGKPLRFEDLGRLFLQRLVAHAGGALDERPRRIIVGRPVEYAGARPDPELARQRYDAMLAAFGTEIYYVHEPLGAAHSYASRLTEPATILVADFGGGTTDFSIVRVAEPGAPRRCVPLASSGIGIAGDRFDYRIVNRLVLPLIGRMIALIEHEQGFPLYDAVGKLKRALSGSNEAPFHFSGGGIEIGADVRRADFERWIADDLKRIEAAMDQALARAGIAPEAIDRVFLTGGSSLIPAISALFERRFGEERIATGGELTSIAHGLALIGEESDPAEWAA